MYCTIVEDKGGSTAIVKLDGRFKPIPFHKGMLYAPKLTPAWSRLTGATRDFSEIRNRNNANTSRTEHVHTEPIARRLRSRHF